MSEHSDGPASTAGSDTPIECDAAARAVTMPRLAVFHADASLLAHVNEALAAMHADVVYRSAIDEADQPALTASGAAIALINLDDRCDERLDTLTAMLDAAGVPAVFNDADISRGLEGWARARWARHLAAKLCGTADVDPPRPAQAVAIDRSADTQSNNQSDPAASDAAREQTSPSAGEIDADAVTMTAASRPLTQGEIESLLADFPSDAVLAGGATEALSAHVDALLANAADSASKELASWETAVSFAQDETHVVAGSAEAAAQVAASDPDSWQLLDEPLLVYPAPRESAAPIAATHAPIVASGSDFELEPLQQIVPVKREREFSEMRLDEKAGKRAGAVK